LQVGLRVHDKPESQEVCFIHDASYHSFCRKDWGNRLSLAPSSICKEMFWEDIRE
jgi:tRNA U34 2-thiouridine synthase MnmA/TrmU